MSNFVFLISLIPPSVDPVFIALALAMLGVFKNPLVTTESKNSLTSLVSPPKAFTTLSKDISSFNPSGAKPFSLAILIMSFLYSSLLVFTIALASVSSAIVIFSSRYVAKSITAPVGTNVGPKPPIFSLKKPDHHEPCFDFIAR